MKALAEDNRTLVATIHQPSSQIFEQIDQLLLLANGQIVFSGPPSGVIEYFGSLGYPFPVGFSIPDYCRR